MAGSAEEFKLAPGAKRLAPAPRLPRRASVHRLLHGLAQLGGAGLMTLGTGCSLLAPAPPARKPSTGLPPSAPGTVPAQPAAGATAAPQPFGPPPNALSADAAARDLVAQAMLLVGTPYRWGGANPEAGFDCSGLVRYVFAEALRWKLPGTSREQFRIGQEIIDQDALLPADLVFFSTSGGRASHVGIFVGNRNFVHAPNARSAVRIEAFRGSYWLGHFDGGRRLLART